MANLRNYLETYYLGTILSDREILRKQGKYAEADKIRDLLKKAGIVLTDKAEGTFWEVAHR